MKFKEIIRKIKVIVRVILKIIRFAKYLEIKEAIKQYKEDNNKNPFEYEELRKKTVENREHICRQRNRRNNNKKPNK